LDPSILCNRELIDMQLPATFPSNHPKTTPEQAADYGLEEKPARNS
jgi:hypothetical protein